jgi:hypothetical protein
VHASVSVVLVSFLSIFFSFFFNVNPYIRCSVVVIVAALFPFSFSASIGSESAVGCEVPKVEVIVPYYFRFCEIDIHSLKGNFGTLKYDVLII